MNAIRSICVYCGSAGGRGEAYLDAGRTLGRAIAGAGLRLVYGGGTVGIMGAVARGAFDAGGGITGIIPRFLIEKERAESAHIDELIVTEDMHARKHAMFERSDAFVALPGGIGTLEEVVEIMTWAQLGRHRKPIVFANVDGFWEPMLSLMEHMGTEGFIHTSHLVRPLVVDDPARVVAAIVEAATAAALPVSGDAAVIRRL